MGIKEALPYVVGAYMGIWVVLLGYVFIMNNRLSGVKKELGALSEALEKRSRK
ncbi:MAG: CcmD family protein [Bacillota bacterium]